MGISLLMAALDEYVVLRNDFHHEQADSESLERSRQRFLAAFSDHISIVVERMLENYDGSKTTLPNIEVMDSFAETLRENYAAALALKAAPEPPEDIEVWLDTGNKRAWAREYSRWYEDHVRNSRILSSKEPKER
jgi:hypothetical protein